MQRTTVKPGAASPLSPGPGALACCRQSVYSTQPVLVTLPIAQPDEDATTPMVIFRDTRRFELTLTEHYDTWVAKLQAFVPDRLYPTSYLLRQFATRQEASAALVRKWHILFPDEAELVWHDPVMVSPPSPPRRPRRPEGRER